MCHLLMKLTVRILVSIFFILFLLYRYPFPSFCFLQTNEQQAVLCCNDAITALAPLISCQNVRVQMPAIKCFAQMCHQNEDVANEVASCELE